MSTLIFVFVRPFEIYFAILNGSFLIGGYLFIIILFDKLFPLREREINVKKFQNSYRSVEKPTFFTRHVWVSIIVIFGLQIILFSSIAIVNNFVILFSPDISYPYDFIESFLYTIINIMPLLIYSIFYALLYFILIPKVLGIPYGRKKISSYLEDIGCNWLRYILKYSRFIVIGTILLIVLIIGFYYFATGTSSVFFPYDNINLVINLVLAFWFEVVHRGVFLTHLSVRYKRNTAIFLHLIVVFTFSFLFPIPTILFFQLTDLSYLVQFLTYLTFFLIYNSIMGYLYSKTKTLLPNLIIIALMEYLFYPLGVNLLFLNFPFAT